MATAQIIPPEIIRDPTSAIWAEDSIYALRRWLDCHLKGRQKRALLLGQSLGYNPSGAHAPVYIWYRKRCVPVLKRAQVKQVADELYAKYATYDWGKTGRKGRDHAWKQLRHRADAPVAPVPAHGTVS